MQRARRVRFLLILTFLLQLLSPDDPALSQDSKRESGRPYRIATISIYRRDVFSRRSGWFGSMANRFHVVTQESIIRNELLFGEGDVYDPELLDETERNLRGLGIIGDVAVIADTLSGRRIRVRVYTHDRWTLGLKPAFKQEGGVRDMRLLLNDNNLMGSGQSFTVGYNYRSDRTRPHGAEVNFAERRLFGSWLGLSLIYKNSEDEILGGLNLLRPFFSEETRWAGGLSLSKQRQKLKVYHEGSLLMTQMRSSESQGLWGALALGTRQTTYRFGAAFNRSRASRGSLAVSASDQLDMLTVAAAISRRKFYKGKLIENFGRVEDVPLGYMVSLIAGPNIRFSRSSLADAYARLDIQYAFGEPRVWYANIGSSASGFLDGGKVRDGVMEFGVLAHWRAGAYTTAVGRLSYVRGLNWSAGRQLLLGSPTGLRGYDPAAFSGQQQVVLNLESRIFSRFSLWIFRLGGAAFFDAGTAWAGRGGLGRQRLHGSAGVGLRIENSAQQGSGLLRIDFPFNFDKGRFTEIAISSDQLFRAFTDLAFIPPSSIR